MQRPDWTRYPVRDYALLIVLCVLAFTLSFLLVVKAANLWL